MRFSGGYDRSALVKKGWAADRTIGRQVKTLQASTRSGVAVYFRPHQGAKSELPCVHGGGRNPRRLAPARPRRRSRLRARLPGEPLALDTSKVGFVVPLRADTGWAERFVADVPAALGPSGASSTAPSASNGCQKDGETVWKGLLRRFPVVAEDGVCT